MRESALRGESHVRVTVEKSKAQPYTKQQEKAAAKVDPDEMKRLIERLDKLDEKRMKRQAEREKAAKAKEQEREKEQKETAPKDEEAKREIRKTQELKTDKDWNKMLEAARKEEKQSKKRKNASAPSVKKYRASHRGFEVSNPFVVADESIIQAEVDKPDTVSPNEPPKVSVQKTEKKAVKKAINKVSTASNIASRIISKKEKRQRAEKSLFAKRSAPAPVTKSGTKEKHQKSKKVLSNNKTVISIAASACICVALAVAALVYWINKN